MQVGQLRLRARQAAQVRPQERLAQRLVEVDRHDGVARRRPVRDVAVINA